MVNILADSKDWFCDGTLKLAPAHFYQHYMIHGLYKGWPLPGCYSFMSGKTYDIYNQLLIQLKQTAISYGLALDPKILLRNLNYGQEWLCHYRF